MNGAEIVLLVVMSVAFAAASGVIVYNLVKGKSCCGDCDGCSRCHVKKKNGDCVDNSECTHCGACNRYRAAAEDKDVK